MARMADTERVIGMISGNGIYPETFARAAKHHGVRLVAAAFKGETREDLAELVDTMAWFRVGQLGKIIKYFAAEGVREAVMVGQIAPKNLFDLVPDLRTIGVLARLKERNADFLFGAVRDELQKDGIRLLPATTFLEDHLPAAGPVCIPCRGRVAGR